MTTIVVTEDYTFTNGGFETGDGTGWTVTAGNVNFGRTINPYEGTYYAEGGTGSAFDSMYQDITLSSTGLRNADIDAGIVDIETAWATSSGFGDDQVRVAYQFLDAGLSQVGSVERSSYNTPTTTPTWATHTFSFTIPATTRTVRQYVDFNRVAGSNSNGYIDAMAATFTTTYDVDLEHQSGLFFTF